MVLRSLSHTRTVRVKKGNKEARVDRILDFEQALRSMALAVPQMVPRWKTPDSSVLMQILLGRIWANPLIPASLVSE